MADIRLFVVELKKVYFINSLAEYDGLKNALIRSGFHFYVDTYTGKEAKYEKV